MITPEQYLTDEHSREHKHQLIDGQVLAMTGASVFHQRICTNLTREISSHLRGSPCEVFSADMKVRAANNFFYPDLVVDCNFDESQRYYTQTPVLIVEVLSKSTSRIDRTTKRLAYINIPTMREYVLIEQEFASVEVFRKSNQWQASHYLPGDEIYFESLEMTLAVTDIYERINFDN